MHIRRISKLLLIIYAIPTFALDVPASTFPLKDYPQTVDTWLSPQAENYHKPSDEFDPNWDLSGMIDDLRLLFRVGYKLSMESKFPNWREGTEFKAKRDADMEEAKKK